MDNNIIRRGMAAFAIAALALCSAPAQAAADHDAEVILEWDQLLQSNIPATAGLTSFRYYSMMHIAMFDAVNSVQGGYQRYHVRVHAHPVASAEAAAAQAAHDILVALIPAAAPTFDTALANRLATLPPRRAAHGVQVGQQVAEAVLAWRTGDGTEQPNRAYVPPALPGLWQPTPATQVAAFVQFSGVEPFGLLTPYQYLPVPPPLLNSAQYAADFQQVKDVGSVGSAVRTADQDLVARLFAGVGYGPGPFSLWTAIARDVARNQHLSLIRTARLFAHMSASMHDGLQTAHSSKFVYALWRPITAIRRADEDLNDQTTADPAWTPLLATPPYPSHSSNLTCIGASAARALARNLRSDEIPFAVTWTGTGGNANVTRQYSAFSQLATEGGLSRIYGGIHFAFEITASYDSCTKVADYIYDNYMRRWH